MTNELFDLCKRMSNKALIAQMSKQGTLNRANAIAAASLRKTDTKVFFPTLLELTKDTDIIAPPYSIGDLARGALIILGYEDFDDKKASDMAMFLRSI